MRSSSNLIFVLICTVLLLECSLAFSQEMNYLPSGDVQTRWYSGENPDGIKGAAGKLRHGRKGAPCLGIPAGGELILADIKDSGTIRRIWCTTVGFDPVLLRSLVIEMYWDGADKPAVQVPLPDFFCQTFGHMVTFENALFSSPKGTSFNCVVPMSFRKGAKILVKNESDKEMGLFYEVDATLGEKHGKGMMYFHSNWRRENLTKLREDFTILPKIKGRGRFLGCNLGFRSNPDMVQSWWGEGEVKVYLDGDSDLPTLCGTGTEDYIGSGYGQDYFSHLYQGNHFLAQQNAYHKDAYAFYRLHIPDPVYFKKDIRVTIQVMGGPTYPEMLKMLERNPDLKLMKAGDGTKYYTLEELRANPKKAGYLERQDDWCATSYWYMTKPTNSLPTIAQVEERIKDLPLKIK